MERSELLTLPVFDGIRAENLPKMLDCLGCYEKHYRKNEMIMLEEETVDGSALCCRERCT